LKRRRGADRGAGVAQGAGIDAEIVEDDYNGMNMWANTNGRSDPGRALRHPSTAKAGEGSKSSLTDGLTHAEVRI